MKGKAYVFSGIAACLTLFLFSSIAVASSDFVKPQSPVEPVPDRDVYYPGSEALAPDEMRVTACGTGMPAARRGQAAARAGGSPIAVRCCSANGTRPISFVSSNVVSWM